MKQKLFILQAFIITCIFTVLQISCNNEEQSEDNSVFSKSEEILKKHARFHNSGLDYIKLDVMRNTEICTKNHLDSLLTQYVANAYNKHDAHKIMRQIAPMESNAFNGNIPSLEQIRGNASTNIAIKAANECMGKISNHLNTFRDEDIFDNKSLLNELHTIIINTYNAYIEKCSSEEEAQTLEQSLGVLYGSIEYWTNSENVESWSNINIEENKESNSNTVNNVSKVITKAEDKDKKDKTDKKDETKQETKKLSKAEYIAVVAAADTAGSFLGAAIASGPAAVAASAAAALYFEVEE